MAALSSQPGLKFAGSFPAHQHILWRWRRSFEFQSAVQMRVYFLNSGYPQGHIAADSEEVAGVEQSFEFFEGMVDKMLFPIVAKCLGKPVGGPQIGNVGRLNKSEMLAVFYQKTIFVGIILKKRAMAS